MKNLKSNHTFLKSKQAQLVLFLIVILSLSFESSLQAQVLYEEDFDSAPIGTPPSGWTQFGSGDVDPGQSCSGNGLRMNLWVNNDNSTLSSPVINRGAMSGKLIISFDYRVADWNIDNQLTGTGQVGMSLNTNSSNVWVENIFLTAGCERQTLTRSLSQVPLNSDFRLSFIGQWNSGDWAFVVDNITVRVIPDNCFDAHSLTQSTISSTATSNPTDGSLEGATGNLPACTGTNNDDVWYSFTATTRAIDITVLAGDVVVQLFEGNCSGLNSLVCNDVSGINEIFRYDGTIPGDTYFVRVHSFGNTPLTGPAAEFKIEVGTPFLVNDECVSAQRISQSSNDFCSAANSTSATLEQATNSLPDCSGTTLANDDVWFSFDASTDHFQIEVSGGDVVVELMNGSCGSLNSLRCVDNSTVGEIINFDGAIPGDTYYVRVYSFGNIALTGAAAEFNICVYTVCPNPPTNLSVSNVTTTSAVLAGVYGFGLRRDHVVVAAGAGPFATRVYEENSLADIATVTGLNPATAYDYYVFPDCGSNTPVGPTTFTTKMPGDECADAFPLTQSAATSCGPNLTMGTVENATESLPGCTGTANDDVWYAFEATSTNFTVFLESGDFVVQLFEGDCGNLVSLDCKDDIPINESFNYTSATIGQYYYLRIYSFGNTPLTGTDAEFGICVFTTAAAPMNDDCADATELLISTTTTCVTSIPGTTNGGSRPETDPRCSLINGCTTVWYSFTATETEHVITLSDVEILNGTDNARASFEVFSGGCGARSRIKCSGQLFGVNPSPQTVSGLIIGQEYLVRVIPVNPFDNIDFDICITTDCLEPATGLTVTDITSAFATISISNLDNKERDFIVVPRNADVTDNANYIHFGTTTGNFVIARGLLPNTDYDFYVQSCNGDDIAGPAMFTTPCSQDLVLLDFTQGIRTYLASSMITSSEFIASDATIIYDAKNSIELIDGFEVSASASFEVKLDGCTQ